jgi:alpha-1,2-mannosyltransferase
MLPLWLPFTRLSFAAARAVWFLLSVLLLGLCVPVISARARLSRLHTGLIILASTPTLIGLAHGQVSFLLMFAMTAAWSTAREKQPAQSGAWLGFLCAVKPFYGVFGLWLLAKRDWRGFGAMCSVFVALTVAGLLIIGEHNFEDWVSRLRDVTWQGHLYNVSAIGVGARLFGPPVTMAAANWTPLVVSRDLVLLTTAALLLLIAWLAIRAASTRDTDASFAALGVAGLLLSPLGWVHYLPVAAGPLLAVFSRRQTNLGWAIGILAVLPYQIMVNRTYGELGTFFVGQWSFVLVFLCLASMRQSSEPSGTAEIDRWQET